MCSSYAQTSTHTGRRSAYVRRGTQERARGRLQEEYFFGTKTSQARNSFFFVSVGAVFCHSSVHDLFQCGLIHHDFPVLKIIFDKKMILGTSVDF